jgi:hypothetical protein
MTIAALSQGTNVVYRTFGVAAGFKPRDSYAAPVPVTVLVERDLSRFGEVAKVNAKTAIVCVRRSDLADAPRRGDTFSLSESETLTVDGLQATNEFEHRVFAA